MAVAVRRRQRHRPVRRWVIQPALTYHSDHPVFKCLSTSPRDQRFHPARSLKAQAVVAGSISSSTPTNRAQVATARRPRNAVGACRNPSQSHAISDAWICPDAGAATSSSSLIASGEDCTQTPRGRRVRSAECRGPRTWMVIQSGALRFRRRQGGAKITLPARTNGAVRAPRHRRRPCCPQPCWAPFSRIQRA